MFLLVLFVLSFAKLNLKKFHFFPSKDLSPSVKNILLLDSEGKRVAVRYYSDEWPTNSAKLAFEKSVFTKTLKSNPRTEGMLSFDLIQVTQLITVIRYEGFDFKK